MNAIEAKGRSISFPPASEVDVLETQAKLGFQLPPLLKAFYLEMTNGGIGPGQGGSIIGVTNGYVSDFGTLAETYFQLKKDDEIEGREWEFALLPFVEWGCNLFTCVDCGDSTHLIYFFDQGDVAPRYYSLEDFFTMWADGVDMFTSVGKVIDTANVVNPFTGQPTQVHKRR